MERAELSCPNMANLSESRKEFVLNTLRVVRHADRCQCTAAAFWSSSLSVLDVIPRKC